MATSSTLHVAVAGLGGTLSHPVVNRLLDAGFKITALTRDPERTKAAFPRVHVVVECTYEDSAALAATLESCGKIDSVVCLLNRDAGQQQLHLIDACINAGVPHIIPSSFGLDMQDPELRTLPPLLAKTEMEDYIRKLASESRITFTAINTGMFLDWALENNVIINLKEGTGPVRILDGGDVKLTTTALDDVGKAVVAAIKRRAELVNRFCFVQSAAVSQNQLLNYAQEARPDRTFETIDVDTVELLRSAEEKIACGDRNMANYHPYFMRNAFGKGNALFKTTDNETLGIQGWDEQRLKKLVSKILGKE